MDAFILFQHHFIQDETGIEIVSNLPKVTWLEVAELGIELSSQPRSPIGAWVEVAPGFQELLAL